MYQSDLWSAMLFCTLRKCYEDIASLFFSQPGCNDNEYTCGDIRNSSMCMHKHYLFPFLQALKHKKREFKAKQAKETSLSSYFQIILNVLGLA